MSFQVGTVSAKVTANTMPFDRAINGVRVLGDKVAKDIARKFETVGSAFTSVGRKLTMGITTPIMGAGALAVKTAADYETLRVSMDTLNGSAREGARNFERLKRFSAGTPFQLGDLAKAQNMLQGFGQSADDAFNSIKMIGDIAAVTGGSIEGIGVAFGQAAAEGKLMTRDIRQFINQGVPMVKMLADTMGVAQSEVFGLAETGQISFGILQKAFRDATRDGGMFADGMKKQSETIGGLFSTLKDNVSLALGEVGQSIAKEIDLKNTVKKLTYTVQLVVKRFQEMSDESRGQIIRLAKMLAASGPLAIAIGQAAKFIALFAKFTTTSFFKMVAPIVGFIALVNEMTKAMAAIYPQMRASFLVGLEQAKKKMGDLAGETAGWMLDMTGASGALDELNEALKAGLNYSDDYYNAVDGFASGIQRAQLPAKDLAISFREINNANISPTLQRINANLAKQANAASLATDFANTFTSSFGAGMDNLIVQGERFIDVLKNIGKLLLSAAIQKGISLFLTGGLSGGGFFSGGLFGKIFGGNKLSATASASPVMSESKLALSFEKALDKKLQKLSDREIYAMTKRGSVQY